MIKKNLLYLFIISVSMLGLFSCATIPKNATAVTSFDKEKYLGKWYEFARFDFKFEKKQKRTSC